MKKIIAIVIIIILAVGTVGAYFYINSNVQKRASGTDATVETTAGNYNAVDACSVLTPDIAKQTLGSNITKASTPNSTVSSSDITVSTCSYISNAVPTGDVVATPKSSGVWLIVRSAKSAAGADSNKAQFLSDKPSNVKPIDGLGDGAFYNDQFRQLNVLKGNNWYIITAYKDSVLNGSLDSNKAVAAKMNFK
jgi:hypothetical protein